MHRWKNTLKADKKRQYHRKSTMSKAEIMVIMILFHDSGYRCLKHFYIEKVCRHMRHLFPKVVSYNRFVELEKEVAIPLALFIKKVLLGKCTGIGFVDSTPLRVCRNQRYVHQKGSWKHPTPDCPTMWARAPLILQQASLTRYRQHRPES